MKLVAALLVGAALGCSGNGAVNPLGTGGSNGGGGNGGTGGAGGAGGDPSFVPFAPCTNQGSYVTGATTIAFGGGNGDSYSPPCLQVPIGATVTFAGDFGNHPLAPSAARGTQTGNPISPTGIGSTASFSFPVAGFWAYFCTNHGSDPDGTFMSGVIWAK
ncbi:MAG TPA: hypothetical protein VIQ54_26700 [Polyangia bacterium]|jgi:plastocyanin